MWTWNAIGKQPGAWRLDAQADEARKGFLLNHLISDELPAEHGARVSNSDPVTGQAGWYDVRVRIRPADAAEEESSAPRFETMQPLPGTRPTPRWLAYFAGGKTK